MSGASGLRKHGHASAGDGGAIPGVSDIVDLPTAETDATLVLAPNGGGGVEFRAEAGGGGGITQQYLGYNTAGGTFDTGNSVAAKSVSVPAGLITSIGAYVKGDAGTLGNLGAAILENSAGSPDRVLAHNYQGLDTTFAALPVVLMSTTARWIEIPLSYYVSGTTTLWLVVGWAPPGVQLAYDGSGTDKTLTNYQGSISDGAIAGYSASVRKFSIRANHIS